VPLHRPALVAHRRRRDPSVKRFAPGRPRGPAEDVVIQIGFEDGAWDRSSTPRRETRPSARSASRRTPAGLGLIDDFPLGDAAPRREVGTLGASGKGHREEIDALLAAVRGERPARSRSATMAAVTRATFRVHALDRAGS
jgi:hypothetical protein